MYKLTIITCEAINFHSPILFFLQFCDESVSLFFFDAFKAESLKGKDTFKAEPLKGGLSYGTNKWRRKHRNVFIF